MQMKQFTVTRNHVTVYAHSFASLQKVMYTDPSFVLVDPG